jgi:hypothetical protein
MVITKDTQMSHLWTAKPSFATIDPLNSQRKEIRVDPCRRKAASVPHPWLNLSS